MGNKQASTDNFKPKQKKWMFIICSIFIVILAFLVGLLLYVEPKKVSR